MFQVVREEVTWGNCQFYLFSKSIILKIEGAEFNEKKTENKATRKTCAKMEWKKKQENIRTGAHKDPQNIKSS